MGIQRWWATKNLYDLWELASENDGSYLEEIETSGLINDSGRVLPYDPGHFSGQVPRAEQFEKVGIICAKIAQTEGGGEMLVVLTAYLQPMDSTVKVLRVILIIVSIVMLAFSLLLAFVIARRFSRPLIGLSASARELANGKYDAAFTGGGCREITDLSDALNYAEDELSKVDHLRRELIANISHDLRTPLTMITGYGEMMRDIPGENTPENVQIIIDEANRLTKLVNNLLDLSKLQSGNEALNLSVYGITSAVEDIVDRYAKLVAPNGIHLRFINSGGVYVEADETRIAQAVYNLISNAVAHSKRDDTVTVFQTVNEGRVRISVADCGPGIPQEELQQIWERYRKGSRSENRSGTGLGLAIVRAIVELHHGAYGVMSTVGQGSVFWFDLPVTDKVPELPESGAKP
jgi:signal transduction histidine kinase